MSEANSRSGYVSHKAAGFAVCTALVIGILASLALRPPGGGATSAAAIHQGQSSAPESIRWRVPVSIPTSLEGLGDGIIRVADFLSRSTSGRFALHVFEPGEIVPALGVFDAVREGKTQAAYTWVGYSQGVIPAAPLFAAVPFGMDPPEFSAWWYEGGGEGLAIDVFADFGMRPMLCGLIGPETAGWFRQPISRLTDLEGLKIRFAGLGGKIIERLGASVTMIAGSEIFQALEKGAIDATEYSLPSADQSLGFDRVTKYNYFPGWHQTFTSNHLLIGIEAWNALLPSDQAMLEIACTAGVARGLAHSESLQGPVVSGFKSRGVTVTRLPDALLRSLQKEAQKVMEEEAARDEDFKRVWESQQAFRGQYDPWKRLAYLPRNF